MRGFVLALDRLGGLLSRALLLVGCVAMFALIPMAGWLVFGRYVLNATPTWVESVSLLCMVVITFMVAASAVREEQHLAITFLRDALPPRAAAAMRLAAYGLLAAFGATMAFSAYELAVFGWSRQIPLLRIPDGVRHLPLLIGGAGIALFSSVHVLRVLLGWRDLPVGGRSGPVLPEAPGDLDRIDLRRPSD